MNKFHTWLMILALWAIAVGVLMTGYWTRAMVVTTSQVVFPEMGSEQGGNGAVPLTPPGPLPPQHKLGTPTPWDESPMNPDANSAEPPRHNL